MDKVIFWDFHGTLAENDWMFSKVLHRVLKKLEPDTCIGMEDFKKRPMMGFPWQDHEKEYLHLTNSDNWWKHAESIFADFYKSFGICDENALSYAQRVREELINSDDYCLYDDTIETLNYFREQGYTNIVLSNHIPELEKIIERLGISKYISMCISSANIGYEKPNPKIYKCALEKVGMTKEIWMVGDSIEADVLGPESAGIKAVLVRSRVDVLVKYHSNDLTGLKDIII